MASDDILEKVPEGISKRDGFCYEDRIQLAILAQFAERIDKDFYGNGKPGLKKEFERLKIKVYTVAGIIAILAPLGLKASGIL